MTSQQPIVAPAGYVPQFAMSFGENEAIPISRDRPLPVRGGGTSLAERIAREGHQAMNSYLRGDNASTSFPVGHVLGYFAPPVGRASWIEAITISSTRDVAIWVQKLDSRLNANSAGPALHQVLVGPSHGSTAVIPVNSFLNEGEAYSFILRTAVGQSAAADFSYFCGLHARHVANDFFIDAPRTMLVIGDSISTTTMLGPVSNGRSFFHARLARKLRGEGRGIRRIVKGDGGWRMQHAVAAMERGQLDVGPIDVILVMLGTNDTSATDYRANLASLIAWKREEAPQARMVVVGPPPRSDVGEVTYMQPLRQEAASVVAGSGDDRIAYIDCSDAFPATAEMVPDQVHLSAAAHEALADHIEAELKARGIWALL